MHVVRLVASLESVPVDFLADPDGSWDYERLVQWAGFEGEGDGIAIGALTEPFEGFPEGCAVVAVSRGAESAIALVDCTARLDAGVRAAA